MSQPRQHSLTTSSGRQVDLAAPRSEDIFVEDIAAALSKICRFGAQATAFYSVAQHAVLVADLVAQSGHPELAFAALHHDSHEAFLGDVPTPLKRMIDAESDGFYARLAGAFDVAIADAFGISSDDARDRTLHIKTADEKALLIESRELLPDRGQGLRDDRGVPDDSLDTLPPLATVLAPAQAESRFLDVHHRLFGATA